jgi:anti-anti-sigma factor
MMTTVQDRIAETAIVDVGDSLRAPVSTTLRHNVRALLSQGNRRILLNLGRVSQIDAAGVGELVRVYNMTVAANGVLRIGQTIARVRELLTRVGLFDLLTVA